MNGIKYLIDTCTLIGLQKQNPESLAILQDKGVLLRECAISLVTYIEFVGFYGIDNQTAIQLKNIAQRFTCLPISSGITNQTIQIRQLHKIKLPDALILATAKHYELELITLDDKLKRFASQIE